MSVLLRESWQNRDTSKHKAGLPWLGSDVLVVTVGTRVRVTDQHGREANAIVIAPCAWRDAGIQRNLAGRLAGALWRGGAERSRRIVRRDYKDERRGRLGRRIRLQYSPSRRLRQRRSPARQQALLSE